MAEEVYRLWLCVFQDDLGLEFATKGSVSA
jgi:hypothetical protein